MISGRTAATRSGPLWKSQDLVTDDCPLPGKDAETFGSLCDGRRHRPQMTGRVLPVRDPQDSTRSSQSRFAKSASTPSLYRAGRTGSSDRFATRHERRRIPPKEAAASRLGARRFCRDQGLAISTFSLWRKKLSSPIKEIKQPLAVHRQAPERARWHHRSAECEDRLDCSQRNRWSLACFLRLTAKNRRHLATGNYANGFR
jgi:hypothetical protein